MEFSKELIPVREFCWHRKTQVALSFSKFYIHAFRTGFIFVITHSASDITTSATPLPPYPRLACHSLSHSITGDCPRKTAQGRRQHKVEESASGSYSSGFFLSAHWNWNKIAGSSSLFVSLFEHNNSRSSFSFFFISTLEEDNSSSSFFFFSSAH